MGLDPATVMIGSSIVSGLIGANASSNAADAQVRASQQATQAQKDMFDTQVQMEAPFRQAGADASSRLSYLLGISPTGYGGGTTSPPGMETEAQIRARLAPQFAAAGNAPATVDSPVMGNAFSFVPPSGATGSGGLPLDWSNTDGATYYNMPHPGAQTAATGNPDGLDAAVQAEMARQRQASAQAASTDPAYGSLLKPFGMSDFQLDPGIQFQMQQGNLALQNSQAAKDGVLSGAALKDLIGFNQGMAGTGYQSAFDRYMANKGFTFNSLSDMASRGQAAASNQATGGSNYAAGIAGTITGAGNAAAAGAIGTANALSGGLTGTGNAYLLRNLLSNSGGAGGTGVVPPNPFSGGGGIINDAPLGTEAFA